MGDLTKNLSRYEFACECGCGFDTVDYGLVVMIQGAVDHFSREHNTPCKVEISGPNRCLFQDEKVQREADKKYEPYSSESTHKDAKGADIKISYLRGEWKPVPASDMYKYFDKKYPDSKGLGLYSNRVHVDSRDKKARWNTTNIKV